MNMKHTNILAGIFTLFLLLPMHSYAKEIGAYIGIGMGHSVLDEVSPNTDTASTATKFYIGARLLGQFGFEVGFYDLGTFNDGDDDVSGTSYTATATFAARGASVFVKAGMMDWTVNDVPNSVEISDMDLMYGFGISLPVTGKLLFRTEWETFLDVGEDPTIPNPGQDINLISFGINYMF